ncbi:MAG TPA: Ig-like domain-containing protein, partial [Candidatus Paceibacterota bacterium]|nr:Ig-like domain-containing protein [Candidatus Paceibacterota bacterium]
LAWSGLSEPLPPPPDTTAPAVSITSPDNNATVSGSVTISATASDNIGVRQVQFLLNNTNFGSPITNPPYRLSWDTTSVPNGSHIISAEALDEAGNSGSASVTITVDNPPLPPPPPPPANAPSDLRVTSFSSTEVGLAWTDNSTDETFFEIWRQDVGPSGSVVSDQPWVRVAIVGESVTSYLDTGLVSDYIYYYKVRACNTGGCSLYSNEEGVVTSSSGGSGGGPACTSNEDCRPNEVCIPPDGYETLSVGSVWIGHCTPIGVQEEQ